MKKILLFLFLLLSIVVLSEEKEKTFDPSNYIICNFPKFVSNLIFLSFPQVPFLHSRKPYYLQNQYKNNIPNNNKFFW